MDLKELSHGGQDRVREMVAASLSDLVNESVRELTDETLSERGASAELPISPGSEHIKTHILERFPWVDEAELDPACWDHKFGGDVCDVSRILEGQLEVIESNFEAVIDLSQEHPEDPGSLFQRVVQGFCPLALHQFENYLRWRAEQEPEGPATEKLHLMDAAWGAMWQHHFSGDPLPIGKAKECFLRCYFAEKQGHSARHQVPLDTPTQILMTEFPKLCL